MKSLVILTFLISLSILAKSQAVVDSLNKKIYLKSVHQVDLTKKELKDKANKWVAKSYNNSNYVTRINNDDNILTKGSFKVGADFTAYGTTIYSDRKVEYILDLKFKDGRYRIEIIDLQPYAMDVPHDIGIYLMSFKEYRAYTIQTMESYDGPGKKAALKRMNNDNKFRKDFDAMHNYGIDIMNQILNILNKMDASLLAYMISNEDNNDW